MTCGGSSGGSAVAVATGQAYLATGSDLLAAARMMEQVFGIASRLPIDPIVAPA